MTSTRPAEVPASPHSSTSLGFVQRQIIAGAVGSITTTLILNPVGVIKVRTQAGQGGIIDVSKQVVREYGMSGFWMGSGLGMVQSIPSTVIYMTSYENIKINMNKFAESKGYQGGYLSGIIPGMSGATARTLVVTVLAPLELIRTRTLAGLSSGNGGSSTTNKSHGVWNMVKTIYQTEGGISAFYRGLTSTIMRDTPFSALYWMSFETVKSKLYSPLLVDDTSQGMTRMENATINFLSGSTSGTIAAIITHPFDVLKTQSQLAAAENTVPSSVPPLSSNKDCVRRVCRVMAECCCPCTSSVSDAACPSTSESVISASKSSSTSTTGTTSTADLSLRRGIAHILRTRGFPGLFSGLSMRLATIIPGSGIMITVYEFAKTFNLDP